MRERCPNCLQIIRTSPVTQRVLDVLETHGAWMKISDIVDDVDRVRAASTDPGSVRTSIYRQIHAGRVESRWARQTGRRGGQCKEYRLT